MAKRLFTHVHDALWQRTFEEALAKNDVVGAYHLLNRCPPPYTGGDAPVEAHVRSTLLYRETRSQAACALLDKIMTSDGLFRQLHDLELKPTDLSRIVSEHAAYTEIGSVKEIEEKIELAEEQMRESEAGRRVVEDISRGIV